MIRAAIATAILLALAPQATAQSGLDCANRYVQTHRGDARIERLIAESVRRAGISDPAVRMRVPINQNSRDFRSAYRDAVRWCTQRRR